MCSEPKRKSVPRESWWERDGRAAAGGAARLRRALAPGSPLETRKTRFLVIPGGLLDKPLGDGFTPGVKPSVY